jgi:O-antigen/teichoic acid export membrane protein
MVRAAGRLAVGTVGGQAAVVLAGPLVTRLFSKEDVATGLALSTLLTWLAPAACFRYEAAVQAAGDDDEADAAGRAAFASALAVAVAVLSAAVVAGPWVARTLGNPRAAAYLPFVSLAVLGQGIYQGATALALRHQLYKVAAGTRLVQGWSLALTQVATGLAGMGAGGLVLADVVGRCLGSVRIARSVAAARPRLFARGTGPQTRAVAARYWEFPSFGVPSALVHAGLAASPVLLGGPYGPAAWAAFGLGVRFVWAPVSLVGQALAQAFTGEAGRALRDDAGSLATTTSWTVRRLALVGSLPFGSLALVAPWLVPAVFGAQWALAGRLVQIQCAAWYVQFVVGPVLPVLAIRQRMRAQFVVDSLGLAAMLGVIAQAPRWGWPIESTVAVLTAVVAGTYLVLGAVAWRAAQTGGPTSSR